MLTPDICWIDLTGNKRGLWHSVTDTGTVQDCPASQLCVLVWEFYNPITTYYYHTKRK